MISITHVIQELGSGGAARAMLAAACASARQGAFCHRVLSLRPPSRQGLELARQAAVEVVMPAARSAIFACCGQSDIVQLEWWNSPQMDEFTHSELPPLRLLAWCHVGGQSPPHIISGKFIDFLDFVVACSPFTYKCDAIQSLAATDKFAKN